MKEALLLIDIQNIYFMPGPMHLHNPKETARKAAEVLERFRSEGKTVIHVQHNFEVFSGIHNLVKPIDGEKIIHKDYPNSFCIPMFFSLNQSNIVLNQNYYYSNAFLYK